MDSQHERAALTRADANLAAGAARIRHQERIIEELARDGHDVELALQLLRTLQATQEVMIEHRVLIIRELERLDQPSE